MKNYKVIGNDNTALTSRSFYNRLSPLATYIISDTDPLEIREYTNDDGSHYYGIAGAIEADNLTVDELFETLESFANDVSEHEKHVEEHEYAENHPFDSESFWPELPANWEECVAFLNEKAVGMTREEQSALWEDFCDDKLEVKGIYMPTTSDAEWFIEKNGYPYVDNAERFDLTGTLAQNYAKTYKLYDGELFCIPDESEDECYISVLKNGEKIADGYVSVKDLNKFVKDL